LDLRYSQSEQKFRREIRAWLASAAPAHGAGPSIDDLPARREYDLSWQRKLYDAGYAGMNWPKEYGGRGATLVEQMIYHEETVRARAPFTGITFVGLLHGGPTLIVAGSELQKKRHLPAILRGEEVWCQCFSEPSAGSDLAGLRTRAVRDGDHYVVNGQKIWTSWASIADYGELLVRTDPNAPKHKGISWLILPMRSPGIEIQPLRTLHGGAEFNQVFFEDVRVPVENLVGPENGGWKITNVTLRFERGTAFASQIFNMGEALAVLAEVARRVTRHDALAWEDRGLRREVGQLRAELDALWALLKYGVAEAERTGMPGLGGSAIKLTYSEVSARLGQIGLRLMGRAGLAREDLAGLPVGRMAFTELGSLSTSIAAGSSQIQRNIIAERILGLPKE
jgi:hypothetical protein